MDELEYNPPAVKLKEAIKRYEKSHNTKLYYELPEYIRSEITEKAFEQKINRMKNDSILQNTKQLYEVLRILGITFESLFNTEDQESKFTYYLNRINENIEALREEQKKNEWFRNNANNRQPSQRSTPIKKLDKLLSPAYILERVFANNNKESIIADNLLLLLNPNLSEFLREINTWNQYSLYPKFWNNLFLKIYNDYSLKDRSQLNELYATVGKIRICQNLGQLLKKMNENIEFLKIFPQVSKYIR